MKDTESLCLIRIVFQMVNEEHLITIFSLECPSKFSPTFLDKIPQYPVRIMQLLNTVLQAFDNRLCTQIKLRLQ